MTDPDLTDLFAEGSAPERDAAFAARVRVEIASARRRRGVAVALAVRIVAILAFAVAILAASRALGPVLAMLAERWPSFMGVPVPLVLAMILIALLLRAPRLFIRRPA